MQRHQATAPAVLVLSPAVSVVIEEQEDLETVADLLVSPPRQRCACRSGRLTRYNHTERPRSNFREQLPLPNKPPYTAHLGNLSFDVTEGDIQDLLSGCEVTSVRIVEDKMDKRPKGFGYVEFATVDGLKKALEKSETQFQGRNIRISVADPRKCHNIF